MGGGEGGGATEGGDWGQQEAEGGKIVEGFLLYNHT